MEDLPRQDSPRVLKVLEALKQASQELQTHPSPDSAESNSSAINALLELETESDSLLSRDPHLSALSQHLATLKTLVASLRKPNTHHSIMSFLTRRASAQSLSRLAGSIESEIQAWIDRESLESLTRALKQKDPVGNEDELIKLLTRFEDRVSQGFNRGLQDLVLKSKVLNLLESVLCDSNTSKRVREHCAFAIAALIKFNKDVFVGQVLMGATIKALLTMASTNSIRVLCTLVRTIKSPLVDEIEFDGQIPKIIGLLNWDDVEMRVMAFVCVLEIGYFGRKEAIDAMLEEGLIEKLVELQRSELGGDLMELEMYDEEGENKGGCREKRLLERRPFSSCVARFAVQLEVGEGLRQRERRAFKQHILVRVREASISDAEAATIIAEVLWGSSP
ncbi:hypothetical protein RchiOBHm_Chr2g0087391 [Rosa chinensis]|uniref:Armadillo-like helical protein n=1 Tax=Rosa chinensis TaxID=74649 RepID=A0A2P6RIN2_ROSCH|nr:hypothetical protein RchiOBHm_Chr2g0087391 [Rosa chinensis]